MLERDIERKSGEYAKERGVAHYKFTSPARAAVPDRVLLQEIPEFLRPVIAQYVRFVEYKRTGETATAPQEREHNRLRGMGFTVHVVDSVPDGQAVIDAMVNGDVNP